jgi:hypothetical protein
MSSLAMILLMSFFEVQERLSKVSGLSKLWDRHVVVIMSMKKNNKLLGVQYESGFCNPLALCMLYVA